MNEKLFANGPKRFPLLALVLCLVAEGAKPEKWTSAPLARHMEAARGLFLGKNNRELQVILNEDAVSSLGIKKKARDDQRCAAEEENVEVLNMIREIIGEKREMGVKMKVQTRSTFLLHCRRSSSVHVANKN